MARLQRSVHVLNRLFKILENRNISYCVLHCYENLSENIDSDVDICINLANEKILDEIICNVCYEIKCIVVQKLYYGIPKLIAYDIFNPATLSRIVKLDFHADNFGISWLSIPTNQLLQNKRIYNNIYRPDVLSEFIYLLIKRSYKGHILNFHWNKLNKIYRENPEQINRLVKKYFAISNQWLLSELFDANHFEKFSVLAKIRRSLWIKQTFLKPWKWLLISYYQSVRIIKRIKNPTGIVITILSPDGGGKSSVSKAATEKLLGCFRKADYFHWRPGFLPQLRALFVGTAKLEKGVPVSYPHGPRKRNFILSFLRWLYYSFDYIIGYYLKVLPMKIKTTAVIIDRYYYDIIVDPMRYGFNLTPWLLRSILPIIPKPDLVIYLDNNPEELYTRKWELPLSELKRQVGEWREFIPQLPNARVVTTDKPLEDVVHEVTKLVLERRAEMTEKILKIHPSASRFLWQTGHKFVALPSKKNCRWILPISRRAFINSWVLYQPYSLQGRGYKTLMISMTSLLLTHPTKIIKWDSFDSGIGENLRNILANTLQKENIIMSLSTGTPSPFRKITGIVMTHTGKPLAYVKIGETPLAIHRIKQEASSLKALDTRLTLTDHRLRIPKCLFQDEIGNAHVLIQSPAPFEGKTRNKMFDEDYAEVLTTLMNKTMIKKKFTDSEFYKKIKDNIGHYPLPYRELLMVGLDSLEKHLGNKEVTFSLSHGDFSPWNIIWNGKEIFIFDWESACFEAPAGIDLFHFLFQTGFLLKVFRGLKLFQFITNKESYKILSEKLELPLINPDGLLLLYLLRMAIDEDKEQLLSKSAVERRNLIKHLINGR